MESGMCSLKNEVHLLMKNLAACCFGGLTYWAVGWGLSMGEGKYSSPFNGEITKLLALFMSSLISQAGENFSMSQTGWMGELLRRP